MRDLQQLKPDGSTETYLATVGNISPVTVYTMSKQSVAKNFPMIANAVLVVNNPEENNVSITKWLIR